MIRLTIIILKDSFVNLNYLNSLKFSLLLLVSQQNIAARQAHPNLNTWINAYRTHGHRIATNDPIKWLDTKEQVPELEMSRYGLLESEELTGLDGIVAFSDAEIKNVGDLKIKLNEVYCSNVSAEFSYIEDEYEREWFTENYEKMLEDKAFISNEEKREIATEMLQFQEFDRFMNAKMPTIKRYGGEGAESMVVFFRNLLKLAAQDEVSSIILGMPHRGKLNSLATIFKHKPARIFRKYKGLPEFPEDGKAMMDIPNHFSKLQIHQMHYIFTINIF
jgi:probable 2-oxoglutarate dehydrogenase E1 component DHKTD1